MNELITTSRAAVPETRRFLALRPVYRHVFLDEEKSIVISTGKSGAPLAVNTVPTTTVPRKTEDPTEYVETFLKMIYLFVFTISGLAGFIKHITQY